MKAHHRFAIKVFAAMLLAAAIAALGLTSMDRHAASHTPPPALAGVALRTAPLSTPSLSTAAPVQVQAARVPAQHLSRRISAELFAASSGHAFVEQARKRPAEGGIYYARHVLDTCKKEAVLAGTGISNSEAIDAHARGIKLTPAPSALPGICRDLTSSELDALRPGQLEVQGIAEGDILTTALAALRAARAQRSHAALDAALQRLLALQNPLLLRNDGLELLRQKAGVLWFQSQSYRFDDEALLNAMHLVPCDFGLPCGATHTMVARHCKLTQRCYSSMDELIAREAVGNSAADAALTEQLRQRLSLAIRRLDVAAFLPPKSEIEVVVQANHR